LTITNGQKKLWYAPMKVNIARVINPGVVMGKITSQKICQRRLMFAVAATEISILYSITP
jgi:hypothetical protein